MIRFRFLLPLTALALFASSVGASSLEVSCEQIENSVWQIGPVRACFMDNATRIDSPGYTVSNPKDESITGIFYQLNKKISYLPSQLHEIFPNLIALTAHRCSVKAVTRDNFRNLNKLKGLWLSYNQIEKIYSDTFEDLISLETLDLSYNKLKFINGRAVLGLINLKTVGMPSNVCIREVFINLDPEKVAILAEILDSQCSFEEPNNDRAITTTQISSIDADSSNCDEQIKSVIEANAKLESELNKIRDELKTVRASEDQAKKEITYIMNLYDRLDVLRNETFAAKAQEWQNLIDMKISENKKLLLDLEKVAGGTGGNDAEIKMSPKKVETINGN